MNYPQSGEGLGPQAEQLRMCETERVIANEEFVLVIVRGLTDEDMAVLVFPEWETPESCQDQEEEEVPGCVICGGEITRGGLYCEGCGA